MKLRNGFVSNSSSSSFVCDVCGQDFSGMSASLSDANMSSCENGHTYCNDHSEKQISDLTLEEKRKLLFDCAYNENEKSKILAGDEEFLEEQFEDNRYDIESEMPAFCCPCCQLTSITNGQLVEYMLAERKQTKEEVKKEIQRKYKNYEEMLKDIKL